MVCQPWNDCLKRVVAEPARQMYDAIFCIKEQFAVGFNLLILLSLKLLSHLPLFGQAQTSVYSNTQHAL